MNHYLPENFLIKKERLSMFFSLSKRLLCSIEFTRKYLSRMGRSWWGVLCSGLMSNFNNYTKTTNSITYPPPHTQHIRTTKTPCRTSELFVRGGEVHSVFVGCKGYFLPGGT